MTRFKVVLSEHPAIQDISNKRAGRLLSRAGGEVRRK